MKYVTLYDGTTLPVIGLGTWNMGGGMSPNPSQDGFALRALRYALEFGYTHLDTAEMYANGHTEELIGQSIRGVERSRLFLTTKVQPHNLSYTGLQRSLEGSLRRLGVETVDLLLIHWPSRSHPLEETFRAMNEAQRAGKVRYLGVSNFSLTDLRQAQALSATPIVTNQVPYSLVTREYQHNGVIAYCQAQGILITAYSPVEEGRLRSFPSLNQVAVTHRVSPFQVALAWLVQQPQVITIPMSQNPEHLRQNLAAAELALSPEEMQALNAH